MDRTLLPPHGARRAHMRALTSQRDGPRMRPLQPGVDKFASIFVARTVNTPSTGAWPLNRSCLSLTFRSGSPDLMIPTSPLASKIFIFVIRAQAHTRQLYVRHPVQRARKRAWRHGMQSRRRAACSQAMPDRVDATSWLQTQSLLNRDWVPDHRLRRLAEGEQKGAQPVRDGGPFMLAPMRLRGHDVTLSFPIEPRYRGSGDLTTAARDGRSHRHSDRRLSSPGRGRGGAGGR